MTSLPDSKVTPEGVLDLGLSSKVVLVTGASTGMGRASALLLAREGARLALASQTAARLDQTADDCRALGAEVECWAADLASRDAPPAVVAEARERFGGIDALVNTVGPLVRTSGILDQDDDCWQSHFDSVLMSAVRFCREVVPLMRERDGGSVVNISAMSVRHFHPQLAYYSAQKAALAHFTKNLAREFAHDGIRANAVMPGMIASEGVLARQEAAARERGMTTEEYFRDANARYGGVTWADRLGTPAEIANVVVFLLSDRASYVNGAWVNVDGGSSF
jgi:NAD(P)-dependent dehydrogenase (short-subunit alcohol dehydrogenase family)